VSEAEAGATRLASPQESAVSRQKKLKMRQASPRRKSFSRVTRAMTASRPLRERSSSRSPMRFMAAESRTSPELEARTSVAMAIQSLSEFMLLSQFRLFGETGLLIAGFFMHRERRAARDQTDTAGDEENAGPSPGADGFMEKDAREKRWDHVSKGGCGQDEGEIGPGERGEIRIKKHGETEHAEQDPGVGERGEDVRPMAEVDLAKVRHAAFEHDVARAVAAGDGEI